ncbi:MAG: alpha amylase C-terminal domain-containing protein [Victivallaceae bacterium]|nr:alpha amylase C-terminal domain-containing protein [Victivallaceae bacterium]
MASDNTSASAVRLPNLPERFGNDPYLAPYREHLARRRQVVDAVRERLTGNETTLENFASGHEYFGLHFCDGQWIFREWAPLASGIVLYGDFSDWEKRDENKLVPLENGVWELRLDAGKLRHGTHYLMYVSWSGGGGDRIPAYARYVVQDPVTGLFSAVVWHPDKNYVWKHASPPRPEAALIYESHVGMAQEEARVGSFREFRINILPRIKKAGYNTVQLMAIMGHPYYGSFGYHVANFFAVASRFGTPDEFKELVDAAHGLGLRVIIDLVHSHAVKNEVEGIARIDGTSFAYFHAGPRGEHRNWDSLCFDYGKPQVLHFLLSNCRFYLDEYHLDGFRFDGVTSMMYLHHGLGKAFCSYDDYFGADVDGDALTYLALANEVIHKVRPDAVTIAEDVSGMPGLAAPVDQGGMGFDYRMAMGVTDMWFKLFDQRDESWNMFYLCGELINRRRDEKSVSYVECHDQAIVGGKTAIFTLADAAMYDAMDKQSVNACVDRAVALHKMIRLATAAAAGNGYLNFMGNEFGHPEWIDFPRQGNNWSYDKARRMWHLAEDPNLHYMALGAFDRAMLQIVRDPGFYQARVQLVKVDDGLKVVVFERAGFWFCFNFHCSASYPDYEFEVMPGDYRLVLDSDDSEFDGFGRHPKDFRWFPEPRQQGEFLKIYLPARSAVVLKREY